MLRLALRQLLGRRTATLLAGSGLLIATGGFVTLVSTSQTLTTELSGDIARTWDTPYDLLVRPAGSTTALEDERGLVRSNYLSALARGGITPGQLAAVRRVPGVSVAAPVAVAGAVNWPAGGFGTDLSAEPVGNPLAVYRFGVTSTADAGLSTFAVETHYVVVAAEGVVRYAERSRDAVLTVRGRQIACTYPVSCFAPTVCEDGSCRPAEDPPGYGLEILQPIVIAGIDPIAEAQLAGLDRCVTSGRYFTSTDAPQPLPDQDPPGTRIPALVSERSFVDETLIGRLERAGDADAVLAGASPTRLAGWQNVRVETTTAAELYATNLPRVGHEVDEWPIWSIGDVRYEAGPGGRLTAVPRQADPAVYDRSNFRLFGAGEQLAVPRRTDLSRRTLLRTSALATAAAGLYAVTALTANATGLPGRRRRFTGSYEAGSFDPAAMPNTIWLDDSVPAIDPGRWRLAVVDGDGEYTLTFADLSTFDTRLRATLDCTSGWYAHQDWIGVPVTALVRRVGDARSLLVHSATGYWVRLPVRDLDGLLLATRVGAEPLSRGHGFPLRLVAPGQRGFWWVKWVDRIELQTTPWWWQPPFPVT